MKKFKGRNKKNNSFKWLYLILIVYLLHVISSVMITNNKISFNNDEIVKMFLNSNNLAIKSDENIFKIALKKLSNVDINNPVSLLTNMYPEIENTSYVSLITESDDPDEEYNYKDLEKISEHINDPNPANVANPIVYIYNSHQLENYSDDGMEIYDVTPNVMMAAYLLKEKLNKLGISTIVEDTDITELMKLNGWNYNGSYKASRIAIMAAKNKYDSLKYFIDIHRDSVGKSISSVTINGKDYAKILFLVGLENPTYEGNLLMMSELNSMVDKKYPKLSRGILKKQGKGVNGVYNQDISSGVMLIEVGGKDNNINEVINTTDALANILSEYIKENNNES